MRQPRPRPPASGRRAALLLALLLAAPLQPALAQFGPQGPPAVGVVTVERRAVTESIEFIGRVEAVDRVELRARVTGFLQERLFREGQEVEQGQLLFRLEKAPFEAELARAQATLASSQATQANARIGLERARDLLSGPAGTRARVDDATAGERTASANVLGGQAALRTAQINLAYTEITAPVAGKIGRATYTPGNVVGPALTEPMATIVSQDPMRIVFPVSQRQAHELGRRYESRGGAAAVQVRLKLGDGEVHPHPGRIDFVDTQIDRNTDTILVRALVPNPIRPAARRGVTGDRGLIDGQFVTVSVEGVEPVQAVVVPRAAVLQDQRGSYVLVVDAENRAQRRDLRLARGTAELATVDEGLTGGERVIAEGVQRARPGQPVQAGPVSAPPAAAPAAAGVPAPAPAGAAPPQTGTGGGAPPAPRPAAGGQG